ncbi:MAG: transposase [Candidatus Cybelea sp.]
MTAAVVIASIEATLAHLDHEIDRVEREINQLFDRYPPLRRQRELLTSIPGIGESTAARILGEMPNIAEFRDVKPSPRMPAFHLAIMSPDRFTGRVASPRLATLVCAPRSTFRRSRRCATIRCFAVSPTGCANAVSPT